MTLEARFHQLNIDEVRQLTQSTFVCAVEHHESLDSTNSRALQLASDAQETVPMLVVAKRQTAGRGRAGNRWWSAPGALTFSLILNRRELEASGPRVALTTGIAVCEALHQLCPGLDAALKWPNDVYVRSRKICGILVEAPPQGAGRIVIGIGLNVNNRLDSAPADIRASASSLVDVAGYPFPLLNVLKSTLHQIATHLRLLDETPTQLQHLWETHCMLTDCRVEVVAGRRRTCGLCRGIDADGALRVETDSGLQRCSSGQVIRWEQPG